MSIPKKSTIDRRLQVLRRQIIGTKDPILCRISQGMESAIRWATQDTTRWPPMDREARELAKLLRQDLFGR